MRLIKLTLLTPIGSWQFTDGDLVVVQTKRGTEGFMHGHLPTIVEVIPGPLRYRIPISDSENDSWRVMFATVGYAEVQSDEVTVVVNAAETPEEIDFDRAQAAYHRAEKLYKDPDATDLQRTHARHSMRRARARMDFYKRYVQSGEGKGGLGLGLDE